MPKLDFEPLMVHHSKKKEPLPESDIESIDETRTLIKKEGKNHSVDDLLHAIDKNISSASFHSDSQFLNISGNNSSSFNNTDISDDASPIRPLNLKQQQNLNDILGSVSGFDTPLKENIMQDIPKIPSFDELEFNTKVNRTSSLSRLSGPRQLSTSSICRTLSNKLPNSQSYKSLSGTTTRDNSPSKKSVCFENSPPKIMEYDELTPENSDDSYNAEHDNDHNNDDDPFESNWEGEIKPSFHALPPLPPKHNFSQVVSSPTKDTSHGSLDGSFEDENFDKIELTQDEIKLDKQSSTLEKRLDLVLSSNEVSERVLNDEITKGSSSPEKPLTKKEKDLLYNIKTKDEIESEKSLRDAVDLFEVDLRNNDKDAKSLALLPELRRKSSNSSLKDEERTLSTTVVQSASAPLVSEDGLKTYSTHSASNSIEDLVSLQSALTTNDNESFASASEIIYVKSEDDDQLPYDETENNETILKGLEKSSDYESTNSIPTLRDQNTPTPHSHKKKLSLSESINSGLSYLSSFGRNVKDSMHKRTESGNVIEPEISVTQDQQDLSKELPVEEPLSPLRSSVQQHSLALAPQPVVDYHDVQSYQSSVTENDYETPRNSVDPSFDHSRELAFQHQLESSEALPLLEHQTAEPTPALPADESLGNDETIDILDLQPPLTIDDEIEEADTSFSDSFKETPLFNVSSSSNGESQGPRGLEIQFKDSDDDNEDEEEGYENNNDQPFDTKEILTGELDEDSLNDIEESIKSGNSSYVLKFEPEPEQEFEQSFHQEIKKEESEEPEDFVTPTMNAEPPFQHKYEEPEIPRSTLPSFNSTLFHDKVPNDDDDDDDLVELKTPPTDYISIWHNLPKSASPRPQYSISQRKVSPPERIMKLLNRRVSSGGRSIDGEENKRSSILSNEPSFDLSRRSSLITTSASRPSFIRINSRTSVLDEIKQEYDESGMFGRALSEPESSLLADKSLRPEPSEMNSSTAAAVDRSTREPDSSIVNSSNILGNLSDLKLPEYNNSSDFASAFKDWALDEQADQSNILKDLGQDDTETDNLAAAKKLKDATNQQSIKNIWEGGSNEPTPTPSAEEKSRTPSIDTGKLNDFIKQNGVIGENANVRSSEALGEVIVTKNEDHGVELEYDQDSRYTSFTSKFEGLPQIPQTTPQESQEVFVDAHESQSQFQPTPISAVSPLIDQGEEVSPRRKRFISGSSQNLESAFDLNEEFSKALQVQQYGYATKEANEVIVAKTDSNDLLDPTELAKPLVPEVDDQTYKQRQQNMRSKYGDRVPSGRMRAPLGALSDNNVNIQNNQPQHGRATRVLSDEFQPGELSNKKRETQKVTIQEPSTVPNHDVSLPKSDQGRLYIHINSLNGVLLDQIKYHKASFKLFLDNGKHVISTPKLTLDNNVKIDKEFEVAIEEDLTDLFFTMKVNYQTPDQELVEVVEKTPIKSNRLSRIIGMKQKFKYEKKFITRQKTEDAWDNKFATDGSFGKNKIAFDKLDNGITGKTQNYIIELFNEWETVYQNNQKYNKPTHLIGKLDVTMLYIPRVSHLETLPPSIKIGFKIANHLKEQSNIKMEGYLFQEGGDCELWKRRFFKIEGPKLIAHQEITKKPRAQINLLKCIDILHDGKKTTVVEGQRNFTDEILMSDCFKLKFLNGEIINFNAETKELKDEWIKKLERIVELNKFHQPWVKSLTQNM